MAGGGEATSRRSRLAARRPAGAAAGRGDAGLRRGAALPDPQPHLPARRVDDPARAPRASTPTSLLAPHNEHLSLIPVLIYKSLIALFGTESSRPFQVVAIAAFLASAAVLFAWLRTRIDGWLALGATVLVLFLGAAWEDLLWAFQVGYFGSMAVRPRDAAGAAARDRRGGDRLACALLVVSIACSSLGIPFVAGALVAIATGPRWRSRIYVVAIPVVLYAPLVAGLGPRGLQDHLAREPRRRAGLRVRLDRIGDLLAARPGDAARRGPRSAPTTGAGCSRWRRSGSPAGAWCGWARCRAGSGSSRRSRSPSGCSRRSTRSPSAQPSSSRYQYIGGIFVILIAAELLRGVRLAAGGAPVAAGVVVAGRVAQRDSPICTSRRSPMRRPAT